VEALLLHKIH